MARHGFCCVVLLYSLSGDDAEAEGNAVCVDEGNCRWVLNHRAWYASYMHIV